MLLGIKQSVQSLSHVWLFETPWTAVRQASLSITNSWNLLKLMSIKSVMPSISFSVILFSSCLQSFPASGSFPISQFFASGGQSIEVSASASVVETSTWITVMLTGLPWKRTESILSFLRLHPSTAFQTLLLTMRATSFLSKGFLTTVVDIMVIWIKFTHSRPF